MMRVQICGKLNFHPIISEILQSMMSEERESRINEFQIPLPTVGQGSREAFDMRSHLTRETHHDDETALVLRIDCDNF